VGFGKVINISWLALYSVLLLYRITFFEKDCRRCRLYKKARCRRVLGCCRLVRHALNPIREGWGRSVYFGVLILQSSSKIYASTFNPIKPLDGLICSLTLQLYPASLLKKSASLGGNFLGLSPDDGLLVSVLLLTY
jgi:hypothetical protein